MPDAWSFADRAFPHFPALQSETIFMENAGGSQWPKHAIERMHEFLLTKNVQLYAPYAASQGATQLFADTHQFFADMMGCHPNETFVGHSSTSLIDLVARMLMTTWKTGDEVIVSRANHEANVTPWRRLERIHGIKVVWWSGDEHGYPDMAALPELLNDRTRLVAIPHVSNLIGEVIDVASIAKVVHDAGARLMVDGVAFAPHRLMDVAAFGADFYTFTMYKVFGPHLAAMYVAPDLANSLPNMNHEFVGEHALPAKFEPGCQPYELCAAALGVLDYFREMTDSDATRPARDVIKSFFAASAASEREMIQSFAGATSDGEGLELLGRPTADRVPTFGYRVHGRTAQSVAEAMCDRGIACRFGHLYSVRLCEDFGLPLQDGILRISGTHYTRKADSDRAVAALREVLQG